jgi:hypothetical protein
MRARGRACGGEEARPRPVVCGLVALEAWPIAEHVALRQPQHVVGVALQSHALLPQAHGAHHHVAEDVPWLVVRPCDRAIVPRSIRVLAQQHGPAHVPSSYGIHIPARTRRRQAGALWIPCLQWHRGRVWNSSEPATRADAAHLIGPFHQDQKSATEWISLNVLDGSGDSRSFAYLVNRLMNMWPSHAMLTNGTSAARRNDSRNTT